jgi:hypothetical protein
MSGIWKRPWNDLGCYCFARSSKELGQNLWLWLKNGKKDWREINVCGLESEEKRRQYTGNCYDGYFDNNNRKIPTYANEIQTPKSSTSMSLYKSVVVLIPPSLLNTRMHANNVYLKILM